MKRKLKKVSLFFLHQVKKQKMMYHFERYPEFNSIGNSLLSGGH